MKIPGWIRIKNSHFASGFNNNNLKLVVDRKFGEGEVYPIETEERDYFILNGSVIGISDYRYRIPKEQAEIR